MMLANAQPNVLLPVRRSKHFWTAAAATGIGAGLAGAALMALLRFVQHVAWSYHAGDFLSAVERAPDATRVAVVLIAGITAATGVLLVRRFTAPGPELSGALWFHSGRVPVVRLSANAVLSMIVVALGASLGREAGPKDAGAAIACALANRLGLTDDERRLLVACGAGAGIAAVYNVPFAGALFVAEVLLGSLTLPAVVPALAISVVATLVSHVTLPDAPTYTLPSYAATPSLIVWAIAFGPLAGLAAVAYTHLARWARSRHLTGSATIFASLIVFALLGAAAIPFPAILGNGKNVVQLAFNDQIGGSLLGALLLFKLLATFGCLSTGAPGGLFTPTLTCGSLLGALVGDAWNTFWPGAQPGSYAVIGAASVLAATTLGPISSIAFVLELTYHVEALLVPIIIAVAGANIVARRLTSLSVYASSAPEPAPPAAGRFKPAPDWRPEQRSRTRGSLR